MSLVLLHRTTGVLLLLGVAVPVAASEVDGVTGRQAPLRDSRPALEARFDAALRAAVARANQAPSACDEGALYDALRDELSSPFVGYWLEQALEEDPTLDRRRVPPEDSIYRELGWAENPSVQLKGLGSVVRVGDALVGLDKFGHFFVEGWRYFEIAYLEGEGIDAALGWGERTERTYFGRYTTGVFSRADLVANFQGLRFWLRVAGRASDPVAPGWLADRPYVACRRRFWIAGERAWRQVRRLDLSRWVSPVWDEAVNCSEYRTPEIEAKVAARIAALGAADGVDYTCPVDPEACTAAREHLGAFAPRLLHPDCRAAGARERSWWRLW